MAEVRASTGQLSPTELPPQLQPAEWSSPLICNGSVQNKAVRFGTHEPVVLTLAKQGTLPLITVLVLAACMLVDGQSITIRFWAISLLTFLASAQVFSPLNLRNQPAVGRTRRAAPRMVLEWSCVAAILLFLKFAFDARVLPREVLIGWYFATPVALLLVDRLSAPIARRIARERSIAERYVIVGANDVGLELVRRISQSEGAAQFHGFLDYRGAERLPESADGPVTGNCAASDFADFVRRNSITRVYLALPLSTAPRIQELLKELRDTTATVYFVPNIFAFDLVQARCVEINGMPAFSICDSPMQGMSAFWKRAFDVVLALLMLAAVLARAPRRCRMAIKISSPGPVLFKQRRYGLNGEEILVYKFRSMTVCEDGAVVAQARSSTIGASRRWALFCAGHHWMNCPRSSMCSRAR